MNAVSPRTSASYKLFTLKNSATTACFFEVEMAYLVFTTYCFGASKLS